MDCPVSSLFFSTRKYVGLIYELPLPKYFVYFYRRAWKRQKEHQFTIIS